MGWCRSTRAQWPSFWMQYRGDEPVHEGGAQSATVGFGRWFPPSSVVGDLKSARAVGVLARYRRPWGASSCLCRQPAVSAWHGGSRRTVCGPRGGVRWVVSSVLDLVPVALRAVASVGRDELLMIDLRDVRRGLFGG